MFARNRFSQSVLNGTPDIVLLGIGGNDITSGRSIDDIISNIGQILTMIENSNPNAIVFVEIIAGANPESPLGQSLNNLITDFETKLIQLATNTSNQNFRVITVDMNSNFTVNSNNYADTVHYSESGAKIIADRYYNAIQPYLN